jgi:hypothetical protein
MHQPLLDGDFAEQLTEAPVAVVAWRHSEMEQAG